MHVKGGQVAEDVGGFRYKSVQVRGKESISLCHRSSSHRYFEFSPNLFQDMSSQEGAIERWEALTEGSGVTIRSDFILPSIPPSREL